MCRTDNVSRPCSTLVSNEGSIFIFLFIGATELWYAHTRSQTLCFLLKDNNNVASNIRNVRNQNTFFTGTSVCDRLTSSTRRILCWCVGDSGWGDAAAAGPFDCCCCCWWWPTSLAEPPWFGLTSLGLEINVVQKRLVCPWKMTAILRVL